MLTFHSSRTGKRPRHLSPVWIELARLITAVAMAVLIAAVFVLVKG